MALHNKSEAEVISYLTSLIYDAALDPSCWQQFVDALPQAIPGLHPVLYLADRQTTLIDLLLMSENWNHEFIPEYMAYYDALNPWTPWLANQAPVGSLVNGQQVISTNELKKTEFYSDFLSNFEGMDNALGTVIHRSKESFGVLAVHSTDDMLDKSGDKIARLQNLLTPHLIRAFEISRKLGHGASLANTLEYTLEALTSAALVIDAHLLVRHANGAARALFKNKILRLDSHARITTGSGTHETHILRKALDGALNPQLKMSDNQYFKISYADNLLPLIAQVMPLSNRAEKMSLQQGNQKAQALLIITDPTRESKNLQPVLTIAFGLTRSETRLAAALVNGENLTAYSKSNGIKVDTARSQLKAIFAKTGTHRQAELVSLITQMTSPFNLSK